MIDASDHIGVLHHVINTSNIPSYLRDEAFSEGLVIMSEAAQSFDPSRRMQPGNWIATCLRYRLKNWKVKELSRGFVQCETDDELEFLMGASEHSLFTRRYDYGQQADAKKELDGIIMLAQHLLSDEEYLALIGPAFGLVMSELSSMLGANPKQILAMQRHSRERIRGRIRAAGRRRNAVQVPRTL